MKRSLLKASSALVLLALVGLSYAATPAQAAAQTIVPGGTWVYHKGAGYDGLDWGSYGTQTIGQTFTATAADAKLTDFGFTMRGDGGSLFNYRAYVYAWNNNVQDITDNPLYVSPITTARFVYDAVNLQSEFYPVSFNTGTLNLVLGQTYVIFLSTIGIPNAAGLQKMGVIYNPTYAGGKAVFYDGNDFSLLSSTRWAYSDTWNLVFYADFLSEGAEIDTAQPFYGSSGLGATLDPHFTGGVLRIDQANATYAETFTLDGSAANTIDANGNTATFTGNFGPDVAGVVPNLRLVDGVGGGMIKVSGKLGLTGAPMGAIINAASLEVLPGGSIATNSFVNNATGTFKIDSGATVTTNSFYDGSSSAVVTNNGVLVTMGTLNGGVNNAGTTYASGQINGVISNSGTFVVTGALTTPNSSLINNAGMLSVGGNIFTSNSILSNAAGATVSIGTSAANGRLNVAHLDNAGALNLQNGKTGDSITVNGAYTGGGGSLALDVNLANGQGDRLSAASIGGTTIVSILNVGGAKSWLSAPIVLVSTSGGGGGTFTAASDAQTQAALASNGIVGYRLQKLNDGTDWGLVSTLNGAAVSTVANHTAVFLNTLDTGLRPTTHDLLAEPAGEGWSGHVWMRAAHAGNLMRATTTSDDGYTASVDTLTRLEADGVMAGAETQRTGANSTLQLGLVAGWTDAWAKDDGGYGSRFHTPSVGAYGVLSARCLLLGVQAWRDDLPMRPDGLITAGDIHGYNDEVIVSLSAPITRGIYTFEPYASYRASSAHIDPVAVQGGTGMLGFASLSGDTAGGGVRLSAVDIRDGVRFKPYVSVGVETVAGHGERSIFTPAGGGSPVTLTTTGPGTYTAVSTGVEVLFPSGLQAYGRIDGRTGSAVEGLSLVGGVRTRF